MTKIFAHCFLDESQKKYLEDNFSVNVHNANEKILSPEELISIIESPLVIDTIYKVY